ncbi:hypothetical protein U6A24_10240 [Aquimarina gracilis]|uniref:Uncharacterized protein n=1 Tax=Aquimarina gracilis TaxID=874422 RepID=A0ABU5ZVF4_9FLAO|nr:hypothetical protein [Aquimarina gracilis]MEB3345843.1 hypothetical protein [Aquimarina gracilis]
MKTNFEIILNRHRGKFSFMNLNFPKSKVRQINKLLGRGTLIIALALILPSLFIAVYTNNPFWIFSVGFWYLFFFYVVWFHENPYGINKYSNSKVKFSIKSWIDEARIKHRVKKMNEYYNVAEVTALRNVSISRLEQMKGVNFKKFEVILLAIIGLFITRYLKIDILYRYAERNFNNCIPYTIEEKDIFLFQLLLLLVVVIILYQLTKFIVNQKWIDKKKQIEIFIKDLDDILIEKSKK